MRTDEVRLVEVASAIGNRLARAIEHNTALHPYGARLSELGPGLAGASGIAITFEMLRQCGDTTRDWALLTVDALRAGLASGGTSPGLFDGTAGALFAAKYLARNRGGFARIISSLERAFEKWRADSILPHAPPFYDRELDLIAGIAGTYVALATEPGCDIGNVRMQFEALLRGPRSALEMVTHVTDPPERCINMGMAHGVPGLLGAYLRGVADTSVVADLASFIASTLIDGTGWPYQLGATEIARSAWCYGQPGVSAVLADAARLIGDDGLLNVAITTARVAATDLDLKGVVDEALCHGTMGVASAWWATAGSSMSPGDRRAAVTLASRVAERWKGDVPFGYRQRRPDGRDEDDATLLTGSAGIAAAMLTLAGRADPSWLGAFGMGYGGPH